MNNTLIRYTTLEEFKRQCDNADDRDAYVQAFWFLVEQGV